MITENVPILKIHKLSQAQYDREFAAGRIDENAIYLTPEDKEVYNPFVALTQEEYNELKLNGKLDENTPYLIIEKVEA